MGIKYAVELYSVRDELAKDLWGTLRRIKAMGYEGVEFAGSFAHTAQEVKAALEDTGLVCCGWHTPWSYVQPDNLLGTITYNKLIGNSDIVIPGLPQGMLDSKASCLKTANLFDEIAKKLLDYGMFIGYHNHSAEFVDMEGDIAFNYLFSNTKLITMQLDNGNAWSAGPEVDVYEPIIRFKNRARTVHIKPFSLKTGHDTMIGKDDIDWAKFFGACYENQEILWYIVEFECEASYTQFGGVEACIDALKKLEGEGKI